MNRIALIKRPGILQALVEFDNAEEATKAKYGLNGADIYDNACTLKVEYGKVGVKFIRFNFLICFFNFLTIHFEFSIDSSTLTYFSTP